MAIFTEIAEDKEEEPTFMSESKEGNSELLMVHGNNYSGCTVMWQKPGIFLFIRLGEAGKIAIQMHAQRLLLLSPVSWIKVWNRKYGVYY